MVSPPPFLTSHSSHPWHFLLLMQKWPAEVVQKYETDQLSSLPAAKRGTNSLKSLSSSNSTHGTSSSSSFAFSVVEFALLYQFPLIRSIFIYRLPCPSFCPSSTILSYQEIWGLLYPNLPSTYISSLLCFPSFSHPSYKTTLADVPLLKSLMVYSVCHVILYSSGFP